MMKRALQRILTKMMKPKNVKLIVNALTVSKLTI